MKDSKRLDPAVDVGAMFTLFKNKKSAYPMAHDILSSEDDTYGDWKRLEGIVLGAISLEGSNIMNVPESSAGTKIIMSRYITVKNDAFEMVSTVLTHCNDNQLSTQDRMHNQDIQEKASVRDQGRVHRLTKPGQRP